MNLPRNSRMKKKIRVREKTAFNNNNTNKNNNQSKRDPKTIWKLRSNKANRHQVSGEAKRTLAWDMHRRVGSSLRWSYKRRAVRKARWRCTKIMKWVHCKQRPTKMKKDRLKSPMSNQNLQVTWQTTITMVEICSFHNKTRWPNRISRTFASNASSSMRNHLSNKLWIPTSTCLQTGSRNQ